MLSDAQHDRDHADARTLVTLLHLRDMEDALGAPSSGGSQGDPFAIVSEMNDDANREIAQVTKADDFVVSEKLISLMLTQLSENRHLYDVFVDLLDPDGLEIYLKPACDYLVPGAEANFATLIESARRRGEVALGYRLTARFHEPPGYGVVLNPDKAAPHAGGRRPRHRAGRELIPGPPVPAGEVAASPQRARHALAARSRPGGRPRPCRGSPRPPSRPRGARQQVPVAGVLLRQRLQHPRLVVGVVGLTGAARVRLQRLDPPGDRADRQREGPVLRLQQRPDARRQPPGCCATRSRRSRVCSARALAIDHSCRGRTTVLLTSSRSPALCACDPRTASMARCARKSSPAAGRSKS